MNRTKLKTYAPQARRDFIQAITDRAAFYGLSADKIEPVVERGDVAVIVGREHPSSVTKKRSQLEGRIKRYGFGRTMEALAYTWFNRLVAIRFMELHGYLEHGYRVLSHPEGKLTPEILEHAEHVELPGLKRETVIDLKLDGNKEAELYRLLLIAQCNALNTAMPFLFEKINDETELMLPDNLLHSDSLIRHLVGEIDEEDWQEVEIIGWLYQFYISEKKDEVIGEVVASEDIPAATQLFTPNWIVKYLVQNTLGRQWLATYPQSALRQQMEYYIEPAAQAPEVQEQLKAITPTSLNPEDLTLLDPACGSGHILVEAYDLFKAIYQERGYRAKDIPALILKRNLFGLEIDERAAQLAAFALMMKARADDRRVFDTDAKPNILAFEESRGMNATDITHALNSPISTEGVPNEYLIEEIEEDKAGLFSRKVLAEKGDVSEDDVASLLALFENAKTFGSLLRVPARLAATLPAIEERLSEVLKQGNLTHVAARVLTPLLDQARLLARRYDAVVANPPYMGSNAMNPVLKAFALRDYQAGKFDLFAMFIQRGVQLTVQHGWTSMVTMQSWMFLGSYEVMRSQLFAATSIECLCHMDNGVMGIAFGTAATVWRNFPMLHFLGSFCHVAFDDIGTNDAPAVFPRHDDRHACASARDFEKVPGSPIAYWASEATRGAFERFAPISKYAAPRKGMCTRDNAVFIRGWHEVAIDRIGFGISSREASKESGRKWFPYQKGGERRNWYGNHESVVDWENDGYRLLHMESLGYAGGSTNHNLEFIFTSALLWSKVTSGRPSYRYSPPGFLFDDASGMCSVKNKAHEQYILSFLCSKVCRHLMELVNPTVNIQPNDIAVLALARPTSDNDDLVSRAIELSKADWDAREESWDFRCYPLLGPDVRSATLDGSYSSWTSHCVAAENELRGIEEAVNKHFIVTYNLHDELDSAVADDEITLWRPSRDKDVKRLVSYALGCILGRYSLDTPGVVYAHRDNRDFDPSQYQTCRADDDGIIPLFATDWGMRDDATRRVVEFVGAVWPKEHLEENLKFIADSLGPTTSEQPRDTIRRYLATGFYKHHLSMYKKRPIYWLFSSGKQRAFQCLVYLHRYHEGTLARMRTQYVIPIQGQITARIEQLEGDKAKATSTSHRRKLQKEQDDLKKQQTELVAFEEKLKHAADQKISLDLDDGVKANYGKFGDLLAESKAITGEKDDE